MKNKENPGERARRMIGLGVSPQFDSVELVPGRAACESVGSDHAEVTQSGEPVTVRNEGNHSEISQREGGFTDDDVFREHNEMLLEQIRLAPNPPSVSPKQTDLLTLLGRMEVIAERILTRSERVSGLGDIVQFDETDARRLLELIEQAKACRNTDMFSASLAARKERG